MQGFNMGRYMPPDLEGLPGTSINKVNNKRAPGTLRKDCTQTVRFEMPFAVWCHTCKPHAIIGQGVRFNAEKKKVGKYYSTPIWAFRMKHPACGGWLEIRTDPKNTAYVVTEGGAARDYGEGKVREGEDGVPILTEGERERRRDDAFAALEGKVEQKEVEQEGKRRIEELYAERERDWGDTWGANRRLREGFRRERKRRRREEERDDAIRERFGLDFELSEEREEDGRRARLVDFGPSTSEGDDVAGTKGLFEKRAKVSGPGSKTTKEGLKATSKADDLRRKLLSNTRAAINPFNNGQGF